MRKVKTTCRGFDGLNECLRDAGIAVARGGARLTPRVVLADELGRTIPRATEPFGGRTVVKKQFVIEDPKVLAATLAPYLFCNQPGARLTIRVNGHPLTLRWPKERNYWQTKWTPIRVPVDYLRAGLNECVFSGEDGVGWALLVEHTRWPRRSAKSVDGGHTWCFSGLGGTGAFLHGEYLVRLELKRFAPEGTITSLPLDLALLAGAGGVAADARVRGVRLTADTTIPAGTGVLLEARVGPSPNYDPATWSAWQSAGMINRLPPDARFLQWQATLTTTRTDATPWLAAVTVAAELEVHRPAGQAVVVAADNPPVVRSSYPFAHQRSDEPRLARFRQQWKLADVIQPDGTDFENLIALRNWVRRQWKDGWSGGSTRSIPPWDGFLILELASRQLTLGMCTHYTTVFVHACAALGYTARTQIMQSHCIAEVWSNHWRKWVAFDHSGDKDDHRMTTFHLERDGVPLSALEIHRALLEGAEAELTFSPPAAAKAFSMTDRVKLWDRFCIHHRNDEMSSLEPSEPEHGADSYHYDEYLWWADRRTPPPPWFSRVSSREGDFHWTLNHAEIHLRHAGPGVLRVDLDTETPNLDTLLCRIDGGDWQPGAACIHWPLQPGDNVLEAQPRNRFGRLGMISRVTVHFTP